ncbi:MAG TPA: L-rhamnose isomerase [Rectinemataceae bacterium]|nr:L-rhamnose isomerase [Rectinemataceae bacterium]
MSQTVQRASWNEAVERYAALGVDVDKAIAAAGAVPVSIHCWQGDDVGGFEREGAGLSDGGIHVTGSQPGKARNPAELRMDIEKVASLCPGERRLSLHAIYGDFGGKLVDRDAIEIGHFSGWMDWSRARGIPLDFNSTLFSHPLAAGGQTLSHRDQRVRAFWIEHVERTRRIAAAMGKAQGSASMLNLWIPDGTKDSPVDRKGYRERLVESLDAIYAERFPADAIEDSVEGKLFGIGSEAFVVGSHDFYLGYAATRHLFLTLDMGHFHPTESVADKISAILPFVPGILLHVSRGVRWDSDHVVTLSDELGELARELARSGSLDRIRFGLDYFDASIDRIGAWALGFRSARKALLAAFLEPRSALLSADEAGDGFARLALLEEAKTMPWNAVWDEYCRRSGVPEDRFFIAEVEAYRRGVTSKRGGA